MGIWNQDGIPHKGWQYLGVEDLAEDVIGEEEIPYETCEMCGQEKIRYVHILRHPSYPNVMRVGCVCAEKMLSDYDNPQETERVARNRANRRRNFMKQEWTLNPTKGNYSLRYRGERITLVNGRFGWGVAYHNDIIWKRNGRSMRSVDEAKMLAFELYDNN